MGRYIDAEQLEKRMCETCEKNEHCEKDHCLSKCLIAQVPTADVAPVRHAHWVLHERAEEWGGLLIPNFECSNCHLYLRSDGAGNYCPNCGTKMDDTGEQQK